MQEMRDSGNREGFREMMTELNKKRDDDLKKLLGDKRMTKYTKEMEKRRAERGGGRR